MKKEQLEQCIHMYGKDIYSFCRYLTCDIQEADELYQDTFLKAVELEKEIDFAGNPKSYFLSIAVRIWKNKRRKLAWRKRIAEMITFADGWQATSEAASEEEERAFYQEEGAYGSSPETMLLLQEQTEIVRRQVEALPEKQRTVVLLYYMEELTIKEISAVLKIPEGTVKSRLYEARKQLKKKLEVVLNEEIG